MAQAVDGEEDLGQRGLVARAVAEVLGDGVGHRLPVVEHDPLETLKRGAAGAEIGRPRRGEGGALALEELRQLGRRLRRHGFGDGHDGRPFG